LPWVRPSGRSFAGLRRLVTEPDPVLLLGRDGRWRWPWALLGLAAVLLLSTLLARAPLAFEAYALQQGWISGMFVGVVFPFEPKEPASFVYDLLSWLPYLLPPLVVLGVVHGVSLRRAFSWGGAFRWLDFARTSMALFVLLGAGAVLTYVQEPQQHRFYWPGVDLLPWIALGLGAVLVQTLAEDVYYLGYLYRTWGAVLAVRLPVAVAVITAFISAHLQNADVQRDMLLAVVGFVIMATISIAVLMRTRSLAASAGLHWSSNAFIVLRPGAPEEVSPLALVVYTDRVHMSGASHLYEPATYVFAVLGPALLLVLLFWRRSPFYLPEAAPPPAPDIANPTPVAARPEGSTSAPSSS